MLSDEATIPECPALIIPTGRVEAPHGWRAWVGYGHGIEEVAEAPTRDAAIRALLELLAVQVGGERWVMVRELGRYGPEPHQMLRTLGADDSEQCLLVRVEAQGDGWTYTILEVC